MVTGTLFMSHSILSKGISNYGTVTILSFSSEFPMLIINSFDHPENIFYNFPVKYQVHILSHCFIIYCYHCEESLAL